MDWRRPSELVASGYQRSTGSIPVPLCCFDLWTIGYLMGQGLSRESIERFLRVGAEMLLSGMEAEAPSTEHFEQRLIDALREPASRRVEAPTARLPGARRAPPPRRPPPPRRAGPRAVD